jgi:hypothetical protein
MKDCKEDKFKAGNLVWFTAVVDDTPIPVRYKVIEKSIGSDYILYNLDIILEQDKKDKDLIFELVQQKQIPEKLRICGKTIHKDKIESIKQAKKYYERCLANTKKLLKK